jgi:hypothetical protein
MKKTLLTILLFAFAMVGFSQTTYYWVGGVGPTSFTSNSNWNTALDGTGMVRVASAGTDVLIFDGSNVGGTVPTTGSVVATSGATNFRQLILVNNANVTIERNAVGGTAIVTVNGDGTATDDVQIPIGSTLTIKSQTGDNTGSVNLTLTTAAATAKVFGTLNINGGGCRITSATASSVLFESGSICNVNTALSGQYPFTSTNSLAVLFKTGSKLNYLGGNSIFSNSSSNTPVVFQTGSTVELSSVIPSTNSTSSNFFNGRSYPNVIISGSVTVTGGSFNSIENLTINSGSTFNFASDGVVPIYNNIVNNGTIGVDAVGSSNLLFVNNVSAQTIGGTGTFNNLGALTVGADASVTLQRNISLSGTSQSSVLGSLNFGTSTINGVGAAANTGRFQARAAVNATSATGATITSGSNTVTFASVPDYDALSPNVGMRATGTNIPANTYVIGTNSGGTLTLSKNATGNGGSITLFSQNPTLTTSNSAGIDGSVIVNSNGSISYANGTNFIFNGSTTTPFSTISTNDIGNLTINTDVTTNRSANITGNISLSFAKLTVATGNELTVAPSTTFSGMSSSAYIVTSANNTTGAIGTIKVAALTASKMFPIGSVANYLPVTLAPVNSSDFTINTFQGATDNAQPNGTPLTASQKLEMVDAVWNINRTSGTGNATVSFAWSDALEGANFAAANSGLGVSQYTTSYSAFTGTASSSTNTANVTATNDAVGGFIVGKNTTLPVTLISFSAKAVNQTAALVWQTTSEVNLDKYTVQSSTDGVTFSSLGSVKANNKAGTFNYSFIDKAPAFGANYYRLLSIDLDGTTAISKLEAVNFGSVATLTVYPNPTTNEVNISGLVKGDLVTLSDLVGRTLQSKIFQTENVLNMNLSNANAGVYFISVTRGGKITSTNKIVKN